MNHRIRLLNKMKSLHKTLANCHPSISRGIVWCRHCGKEIKVDPSHCLKYGWPKCCSYTMTIDHPDTW